MLADACLYGGFALLVVGVYLTVGVGIACLVAGGVLFASGARMAR